MQGSLAKGKVLTNRGLPVEFIREVPSLPEAEAFRR
jgi:hypothetical protein